MGECILVVALPVDARRERDERESMKMAAGEPPIELIHGLFDPLACHIVVTGALYASSMRSRPRIVVRQRSWE